MLSDNQKDDLAKALIIFKYHKNQIIVNEGDQSNSFYIIKEGIVHVYKGDSYIRSLRAGESFGESALLYDTPRQMSIKASSETDVLCLALSKEKLKEILKDQLHIIAYKNLQKWAFSRSSTLSALNNNQRERIIERMKLIVYKDGEMLLKKGEEIKKLFIVLNGKVSVKGEEKAFERGDIIFDDSLLKKKDVYAEHDYQVFIDKNKGVITASAISFEDVKLELGNDLEEILAQKEKTYEVIFSILLK